MASNPLISLVPTEQDLQFYQGGPVVFSPCSVTDVNGNPIDCTGGSIVATIRSTQAHTGNTLIATFTTTWISQATGTFTLSLTSEQTDAFTFQGNAFWDVFFLDANVPQNAYPLGWGIVTMQNDVSY